MKCWGQIYVSMAKPAAGHSGLSEGGRPYAHSAPQLRLALATAQLATDDPTWPQPALANLKAASLMENDDVFTWYETAQAYSMLKNQPMANLSTAEAYYYAGDDAPGRRLRHPRPRQADPRLGGLAAGQ